MKIAGIEWDSGNWPKCGKHGLSKDEIEFVLQSMTFRIPDPNADEGRYRTASRDADGRVAFIVFTYRERQGITFIRPISARYMHRKEIEEYEKIEKTMADAAKR